MIILIYFLILVTLFLLLKKRFNLLFFLFGFQIIFLSLIIIFSGSLNLYGGDNLGLLWILPIFSISIIVSILGYLASFNFLRKEFDKKKLIYHKYFNLSIFIILFSISYGFVKNDTDFFLPISMTLLLPFLVIEIFFLKSSKIFYFLADILFVILILLINYIVYWNFLYKFSYL